MAFWIRIDTPQGIRRIARDVMPVKDGSVTYQTEPRLLEISTLVRAVNPDKYFENSRCSVTLENTDRYFTKQFCGANQYLLGRSLEVYDQTIMFKGKIFDFYEQQDNPNRFVIEADWRTYSMENYITKTIGVDEYPSVPEANKGKPINYLVGIADDSGWTNKGMLTAYKVAAKKYLANLFPLAELRSVYDKDGNVLTGQCQLTVDSFNRAVIELTTDREDAELYFNARGRMYDSTTIPIANIAHMLYYLVKDQSSFVCEGIDTATTTYSDRRYWGACIAITDNMKWSDFVPKFCSSFDCWIFQKSNGNLMIKVLDWKTAGLVNTAEINEFMVKDFQFWRDLKDIVTEYQRQFRFHYRDNFFLQTPVDVKVFSNWQSRRKSIEMPYVHDNTTALDVTTRLLFFKKAPLVNYRFKLLSSAAKNVELCDVIGLTHYDGFYPGVRRLVIVTRIEINPQESDLVTLEGLDITGINDRALILYEDGNSLVVRLKNESDPECNVLI